MMLLLQQSRDSNELYAIVLKQNVYLHLGIYICVSTSVYLHLCIPTSPHFCNLHLHLCILTSSYLHLCISTSLPIYICGISTSLPLHLCISTFVYIYICVYLHLCISTFVHIYICVYLHLYIYICIYENLSFTLRGVKKSRCGRVISGIHVISVENVSQAIGHSGVTRRPVGRRQVRHNNFDFNADKIPSLRQKRQRSVEIPRFDVPPHKLVESSGISKESSLTRGNR